MVVFMVIYYRAIVGLPTMSGTFQHLGDPAEIAVARDDFVPALDHGSLVSMLAEESSGIAR